MKKLVKIFIFILLLGFSFRVNAKELVSEKIKVESNNSYSTNEFLFSMSNGIVSIGKSEFDGYEFTSSDCGLNYVFNKYSFDGDFLNQKTLFLNFYNLNNGIATSDNSLILVGNGGLRDNGRCSYNSAIIAKIDSEGNILWIKNYSLGDDNYEFYNVVETDDHNYITVGRVYKSNIYTVIIAKYDSNGNFVWFNELHEYDDILNYDNILDIKKTSNDFVLFNENFSPLIHIDSDGNIIKNTDVEYPYLLDHVNTYFSKDYYVIIHGELDDDNNPIIVMNKYNYNGRLLKTIHFTYDNFYDIYSVNLSLDGNYLISGMLAIYNSSNGSFSDFKSITLCINSQNGNIIWQKSDSIDQDFVDSFITQVDSNSFLEILNYEDKIIFNTLSSNGTLINSVSHNERIEPIYTFSADFMKNDDIIYAGYSSTKSTAIYGAFDLVFTAYDKNRNIIFDTAFGGEGSERLNVLKSTSDNGFIVVGTSQNSPGISEGYNTNALILKLDQNGNSLWFDNYYVANQSCNYYDVIELNDGSFIAVGDSIESYELNRSHPIIVKYDSEGNELWRKTYDGLRYDGFSNVIQLTNNNIVVIGGVSSSNTSHESYPLTVIYDLDGNVLSDEIGSNQYEFYRGVFSTQDGGYITNTIEQDPNEYKFTVWYSKYDKNNQLVWKNEFRTNDDYSGINFLEAQDYYIIFGRSQTGINNLESKILYVSKYDGNIIETNTINDNLGDIFNYNFMENGTIRCLTNIWTTDSDGYYGITDLYYRYDITPKSSSNGSFTVSKIKAKNKDIITINAKPKLGYIVDKVILTDTKGNKTVFKDLTFEMIPDDVEVEVVFRELINPKTGFSLISILAMVGGLIFITIRSRKKREI